MMKDHGSADFQIRRGRGMIGSSSMAINSGSQWTIRNGVRAKLLWFSSGYARLKMMLSGLELTGVGDIG